MTRSRLLGNRLDIGAGVEKVFLYGYAFWRAGVREMLVDHPSIWYYGMRWMPDVSLMP